jgi:RNA polymerase sigma-70 factor (sigma-E family)
VSVRSWEHEAEFSAFVAARAAGLRKTAFLLTGDWHAAEDLTQATFARLVPVWSRLLRRDELDAYARTTLTRLFLDERRRRRWTERPLPSGSPLADLSADVASVDLADDRVDLMAALSRLTLDQRTAVVLRFWEDLSVETVATVMGRPTGTVKTLTARGLAQLRRLLEPDGLPGSLAPLSPPEVR